MRISFLKVFLLFAASAFVVSCDKDFNEIGSDIVGDDHFNFRDSILSVVAFNQFYGPVQTSRNTAISPNLPINTLGYYNNPVFGKVKASFVTQLELDDENPDILDPADSIRVKDVVLSVPLFSHLTERDDDGNGLYALDSLRGNSKIKLEVFASNYYLRDNDPDTGFQQPQRYYSDQKAQFDANIADPVRLNNAADPKENDEFFFNPAEVVTYKTDDDGLQVIDKRFGPQLRLNLRKEFFREKIFGLDASGNSIANLQPQLFNNNAFKQYFRGLYFRVDNAASSPNQGSLNRLNFGNGTITVTYSVLTHDVYPSTHAQAGQPVVDEDGNLEREDKEFIIKLAGNTVNLFENEYNSNYISAVTAPDVVNGDSRLWLKGGAGSMAVIKLFDSVDTYRWDDDDDPDNDDDPNLPNTMRPGANGVPDRLDDMREKRWLINDANITFYVDTDIMNPSVERPPLRLYLYDLKNQRQLVDYDFDVTSVPSAPAYGKYVHGGIYEKARYRYSIRLTNHMRNLIQKDSTNIDLGLVVTETINMPLTNGKVTMVKLRNALPDYGSTNWVPNGSAVSQRGVVLYGSNLPPEDEKRLQLKIYYTEQKDE